MSPSAVAAVGIGAALGAWLRWGLGAALNATVPNLPLGTLTANLVGGYLIGAAVAWFETHGGAPELRLFVTTGFLVGLTTFSAFSGEATALLHAGRYGWATLHIGSHLVGSILATIAGIETVRRLG